ncbi:MAG: nucleoside triphosphate pyrophosphohydrolase [Bacilli bacterium]|nr:nucleoside triphosphate pyrophosphohydrolase [Bacilli bacterium]
MSNKYGKLVRDKIPEIIKNNGEEPIVRILDDVEYKKELEKKLQEECLEVISASGTDRLEELADLIEVMKALAKIEAVNIETILQIAKKKAEKRGAFTKKIYLESVQEKE